MGHPRPLFGLFSDFPNKQFILGTQLVEKQCPSSILCWDSNWQPLEHASSPITTSTVKIYFYHNLILAEFQHLQMPLGSDEECLQQLFFVESWTQVEHKHEIRLNPLGNITVIGTKCNFANCSLNSNKQFELHFLRLLRLNINQISSI